MALEPQPDKPAHESSAGKPVDTNRPRSAEKATTAASSSAKTAADVDNELNAAVNLEDDTDVPPLQSSIGKSATPLTDKLFGTIAMCLDEEKDDVKRDALEIVVNFLWA